MIRSRLFSLTLSTIAALAGLGVGTAAAATASPAGSGVVSSHPPACC
jgi:hypothetical protein